MMASFSDRKRDRQLWTIRLLYLVYFAAIGVYFTFIAVYYKSLGLTGMQIGVIGMLGPLAGIGGMTVWGILNDHTGRTRLLMSIACCGAALSALALSWTRSFSTIVPVACMYALFSSAIGPLLDSITLSLLGSESAHYGRYRVWGTVGYMLTSASFGFVLERTGLHAMFPAYALLMGVLLLVIMRLPGQPVQLGAFSLRGLTMMLRQPAWLVFAGSVFLVGLAFSGTMNFLSVTMRVMGAAEGTIGVSWTMAAASELPIMLFSAVFLRRLGAERLMLAAFALYTMRTLLYSIMPSPSWVWLINGIFGSAYGFLWIGAVNYSNERASAAIRTTAQSMLMSTMNLSNVIGAVASGWLFDALGPAGLFRTLSMCSLAAMLLLGAAQRARWSARPALSDSGAPASVVSDAVQRAVPQ